MPRGVEPGTPQHREIEELLRGMLEPDGYDLVVHSWPDSEGGRLRVEIIAKPEACADCLVPKDVLRMILADRLPAGASLSGADLVYPNDQGTE